MSIDFEIIGDITDIETIAVGSSIREIACFLKVYGASHWKMLKGMTMVRLPDDTICNAEIHWYDAHGVGKKEIKIKHIFWK